MQFFLAGSCNSPPIIDGNFSFFPVFICIFAMVYKIVIDKNEDTGY